MTTVQGDLQGQPPEESDSDPGPADPGQPQNNDEQPALDFQQFRDDDGNLIEEKILGSLKELQKMAGSQSNELGQLRQANSQWADYGAGEQARLDAAMADSKPTAATPDPNYEELLDEQWEANKVGVVREIIGAATREALVGFTNQQKAFNDPMLEKHSDVKMIAQELMAERGMDAADAIDIALGRKARNAATGGNDTDNMPALPPNKSSRDSSSFIQARGIPQKTTPSPSSGLSTEEKAMAKKQGMSDEEYAKWKR